MGLLIALILGGLIGWAAAHLLGRDEGLVMSVIIGVIGSFIGGLVSQLFTGVDRAFLDFSWAGLLWSLLGALILVAILNALTRPHHA